MSLQLWKKYGGPIHDICFCPLGTTDLSVLSCLPNSCESLTSGAAFCAGASLYRSLRDYSRQDI